MALRRQEKSLPFMRHGVISHSWRMEAWLLYLCICGVHIYTDCAIEYQSRRDVSFNGKELGMLILSSKHMKGLKERYTTKHKPQIFTGNLHDQATKRHLEKFNADRQWKRDEKLNHWSVAFFFFLLFFFSCVIFLSSAWTNLFQVYFNVVGAFVCISWPIFRRGGGEACCEG